MLRPFRSRLRRLSAPSSKACTCCRCKVMPLKTQSRRILYDCRVDRLDERDCGVNVAGVHQSLRTKDFLEASNSAHQISSYRVKVFWQQSAYDITLSTLPYRHVLRAFIAVGGLRISHQSNPYSRIRQYYQWVVPDPRVRSGTLKGSVQCRSLGAPRSSSSLC